MASIGLKVRVTIVSVGVLAGSVWIFVTFASGA